MTLRERIAHAIHSRVYEPTNFQDAENIADAILALLPALPPGWVAVPEEPTEAMIAAYMAVDEDGVRSASGRVYVGLKAALAVQQSVLGEWDAPQQRHRKNPRRHQTSRGRTQ